MPIHLTKPLSSWKRLIWAPAAPNHPIRGRAISSPLGLSEPFVRVPLFPPQRWRRSRVQSVLPLILGMFKGAFPGRFIYGALCSAPRCCEKCTMLVSSQDRTSQFWLTFSFFVAADSRLIPYTLRSRPSLMRWTDIYRNTKNCKMQSLPWMCSYWEQSTNHLAEKRMTNFVSNFGLLNVVHAGSRPQPVLCALIGLISFWSRKLPLQWDRVISEGVKRKT